MILIIIVVILLLVYYHYSTNPMYPPGPIGLPILGNLLQLDANKPHISLARFVRFYGYIYALNLGSVYTVVLGNEKHIRAALNSDDIIGRAPLYVTHGIMGGYGLICAEGELWKDQRKLSIQFLRKLGMIKNGLARESLENKIKKGVRECCKMLEEKLTNNSSFDPFEILHHTLGNIMNSIVFGVTYDFDDKTWKYLKHLQEEGVKHIGVSGVVNFLPWLRFLPKNRQILNFLLNGKRKTHQIYDDIIKNAVDNLNSDSSDDCILKLFLKERQERIENQNKKVVYCNDEQLKHLLADLFGAGVDTTLTTIRWFLLFMANNPDMAEQARNEIRQNMDSQKELSLENFNNCHYLKACIAETQRIRSVVPLGIPHGASRDTTINGFFIPKGTMILPLLWSIHMQHDLEKTFNPNRFLNEKLEFFIPPNFLPFQTGKRMCLGEELAKMLLLSFCGNIIYNFDFSSETIGKNETGTCGITLTPPNYFLTMNKISH